MRMRRAGRPPPMHRNPSGRVFDRDHQALAERRKGGVEEVGFGGVGRVQKAGDPRRLGAHAPGQLGRLHAAFLQRQVKRRLGADQAARRHGRAAARGPGRRQRVARLDAGGQRLLETVDSARQRRVAVSAPG